MPDLPEEIWTQIFDLAADEDVIFQYGLPSVMAESAWFKNVFNEWRLRTPSDAINLIHRRSYATKKAIISTCKTWRRIGAEFLFRCLFLSDPSKLLLLCQILDSSSSAASTLSSSIGWWTRRIHLSRDFTSASRQISTTDLENALTSVVKHCPNLEIFISEWPMGTTFGQVADAISVCAAKSLRTIHWTVPRDALPKVIWALDSLPFILSAHIEFGPPSFEDEDCVNLGAAADLRLSLPFLQMLSLKGHMQEFLEQAAGWHLPSLRSFAFNRGNDRDDQPDVLGFLMHHGSRLLLLDMYCIPALDVARVLDLCPMLETFTFNADWRLQPPGEEIPVPPAASSVPSLTSPPRSDSNTITLAQSPATMVHMSKLVNRPHDNITSIGLHGLNYAFGVGVAASYGTVDPLSSRVIQRSNDLNVAALNRTNFPRLQRVRALNPSVLMELHQANGPAEDGGMERYDRWWSQLSLAGVRLEDCTGQLLGTLPALEGDDNEDEDEDENEEDEYEYEYGDSEGEYESDEYDYDDDDEEWEFDIPPMPSEPSTSNVQELRQLLEECRIMAQGREEPLFPPPMFGEMAMGAGFM